MESQNPPIGVATAGSPRKQHKQTSSLGSLYEVLADLDDTQLQYLIQEMNHTGHQNVPVMQAVTAFEGPNPSRSLGTLRKSMLPPAPGLQRRLSKSQQGQLRLQTAFRRSPSLRQMQQSPSPSIDQFSRSGSPVSPDPQAPERETPKPRAPNFSRPQSGVVRSDTVHSNWPLQQEKPRAPQRVVSEPASLHPPAGRSRAKSVAYRRIPRPDFTLPEGVTVTDLLELLEHEFQSSGTMQRPTSSYSMSPSPSFSAQLTPPLPNMAAGSSPRPLSQTNWSRPLRRHSSRLDMVLDAERNATGAEEIGLGMLEPRPTRSVSVGASGGSTPAGNTPVTPLDVFDRSFKADAPPVLVMEGIFDVLENQ
ncbi:hypothetical protein CTRI78_v008318 [Colletotrichum trifolii]|uniref:Uncharacterized protein n=1 Tax=Colletotrichum trifolii TaxID=5466 RepID=A0A4R8QXR7_COLTR|nr:hypothetical protein CTRI78_v008318 [Colletotrichum trifolii]